MPNMVKIGVIGYGYWGPNLVRNFFELDDCEVKIVVDKKQERLAILKKHYPSIQVTTDINYLLHDRDIDTVVIATPVSTHFSLAKEALEVGKNVLVEKPMTSSLDEALRLVEMAEKKGKVLMVDHTFVYKDAVRKIKKIIDSGEIGQLRYFDSTRTNLGLFQPDVNVLWDLAAHDVSILLFLVKEKPISIQASGVSHTKNKLENIAFVTLKYQSGMLAHFNVSWSSPVKIRLILIGGSKKMIVFNDVEPSEKVRIYDSGYKVRQNKDKSKFIVDYRLGDIQIPKTDLKEALSEMVKDFIDCVKTGKKPISDMYHGMEVVKILSLAQESLRKGEKPIYYK
ncbi:oxidoreductase [Candidatus Roizmanbacteria bacterium RIFCSPHIGHO2_02_FULL_37_15]|uniref:Oxidoreductase n=1 Tax=Candidatus Roizmanbacteria bacterium RIFCSPLOWO2_01_FULL_37_16 TaxID=1802058 RepID=A0A1F7IJH7_9BACT|nr:MAG: oxidoreductase [Candidatus Roizmanbacteria bacterium RIFCSPHIGHO2_02_FULL_37_15]OGK33579.1 MAG: oxidoreductase [Candidatus Roizmanbacteria bacterium RIFCSPHIGHO2_12_FULL_36_11]OGK43494.1 MAG: oxidoreductase [Candidatus Roizmanbacteria bacterium RIFCSPLOWO2_01_FULL_37_16]